MHVHVCVGVQSTHLLRLHVHVNLLPLVRPQTVHDAGHQQAELVGVPNVHEILAQARHRPVQTRGGQELDGGGEVYRNCNEANLCGK